MTDFLLHRLNARLQDVVRARCGEAGVETPAPSAFAFSSPKSPEHGDLATNAALLLAKPLRGNPLALAEGLAQDLGGWEEVASAEAARPGFVNVRLAPGAFGALTDQIRSAGQGFGTVATGGGRSILLEFVSANPTGPMHVGHLRHAVLGEALCRVLTAGGYRVTKEYYINDGGVQIETLRKSLDMRLRELLGLEPFDEEKAKAEKLYPGEYVVEVARACLDKFGPPVLDKTTEDERADFAKNYCMEMIRGDLRALQTEFDHYVSEKALYDSGAVERTLHELKAAGATYEQDDATWLRTEAKGDDKDRVLVKNDGTMTYLVPDLAYHHEKFKRGFDIYINQFGEDHKGYPPRLKAGLAYLGHAPAKLEVVFLSLVHLMTLNPETQQWEPARIGKRRGNIVTLMDVIEEVGADAARWFLLERSANSSIEFRLDVAKEQSSRNPVFKVQYAHARCCTILSTAQAEEGLAPAPAGSAIGAELSHPLEKELLLGLARFPAMVERAALAREPHHITNYLLEVADLWNRYQNAGKLDRSLRIRRPDAPEASAARLAMTEAVRTVLANGLGLLAISAPERMERSAEEGDEAGES